VGERSVLVVTVVDADAQVAVEAQDKLEHFERVGRAHRAVKDALGGESRKSRGAGVTQAARNVDVAALDGQQQWRVVVEGITCQRAAVQQQQFDLDEIASFGGSVDGINRRHETEAQKQSNSVDVTHGCNVVGSRRQHVALAITLSSSTLASARSERNSPFTNVSEMARVSMLGSAAIAASITSARLKCAISTRQRPDGLVLASEAPRSTRKRDESQLPTAAPSTSGVDGSSREHESTGTRPWSMSSRTMATTS
jgi:hypothetical protein